MRGLAAMSAPKCAGDAVSRALLNPIRDWPALSVACSELSSVTSGKSLSRNLCPNLIVDFSSSFLWQDCVAMHPGDVVDAANDKDFAKKCKILSEDPGTAEHVRALFELQ